MKLSKLFHTLYATVMALPVLVIPIFALNILHKETEPISIEVQEKVSVDFNQLAQPRDNDFTDNGITYTTIPGGYNCNGTATAKSDPYLVFGYSSYMQMELNHKYLFRGLQSDTQGSLTTFCWRLQMRVRGTTIDYHQYNDFGNGTIITCNYLNNEIGLYVQISSGESVDFNVFPTLIDLTQMYGLGNEPTLEEFNATFTNAYYPYTESQKMLVNKPSPTTYNSTDIGSQFVYALYKPVHDYFNFGDFFGLGGMYDWFQLNIFNGTAPLSFFIVYNVMIYWLFISLFWLLFDILIYVPMVIHKWLDKAEM